VAFRKGASALQRGYAAGARSKAIFRKKFACSSPTQNTAQAARYSVTAGRNALGTIEQVEGGFVAIDTDGVVIGEFGSLIAASRAFHEGGER
jgi:hypothetical protein